MKKVYLALAAILLLFLATRLAKISQVPPSLYWDEASIGYNAYSVLKTGRDEWGEALPLHFRAFGEFKLPVYIYSVITSETFFGLTQTAVRLPAVIYSLGVLILSYLIAAKISKRVWVGIASAFLICLSPWFFIFSRTGYEATAGLMFFLLGIYSLLLLPKHKLFLFGGAASWILAIYSYNSFRVLVPLAGVLFLILFLKEVKRAFGDFWKIGLISLLLIAISLVPIARVYLKDTGAIRFRTLAAGGALDFARNYMSHFSPNFLFMAGDANPRSQIPDRGELYLIDGILVILGALYILRSKKKLESLPLLFLLLAPIPAALTRESPHALRAITMAPFFAIIASFGIFYLADIAPKYKNYIFIGLVIVYLGFFGNYLQAFFKTYVGQSSREWQYGFKKLFSDYGSEIAKADKVVISDEYAQPYIFALFYEKYDPTRFQKEAVRNTPDKWGASSVTSFGKFTFKKIEAKDLTPGALVFATAKDKPAKAAPISEIKFLDATTAFWVYKQ